MTIYRDIAVDLTVVHSDNGQWTLENEDISSTVFRLEGEFEYIENALLDSYGFNENEEHIKLNKPTSESFIGTARYIIYLPDNEEYMIRTEGAIARKIIVNGELVGQNGVPSLNIDNVEGGNNDILAKVTPIDNKLEIIMQSTDFFYGNLYSFSHIYLGQSEQIEWYFAVEEQITILIIGMLFMLAIIHMIVFIVFKGGSLNLICACFCFMTSLHFGVYGTNYLYTIIPILPWSIGFRIEYIAIPVCSIFIITMMNRQFKDVLKKEMRIALYCLITFVLSFIFFANLSTVSDFHPILNMLYIAAVLFLTIMLIIWLVRNFKNRTVTSDHVMQSIAMFFMFSATIIDTLQSEGIFPFGLHYAIMKTSVLTFAIFETIYLVTINLEDYEKIKIREHENLIRAEELENYLEKKSHFIGIVAHEIKTPLSIIMGASGESCDIVSDIMEFTSSEKYCEDLKQITENQNTIKKTVKDINETVFDLLDTSAAEMGRLSLICKYLTLNDVIEDIVKQYSIELSKNNNTIKCILDETLKPIYADEKRMHQVIINLFSNANKYAKNGTITVKSWEKDKFQWISVSDKGPGISKEYLDKIKSQAYVKSSEHNHRGGIGLLVCQQIINSHGGKFDITTEIGRGTEIILALPCNKLEKKNDEHI